MKRQLLSLLSLVSLGFCFNANAQDRYHDPIFTNAQITVTPDVTYGNNMEVSLTGGAPAMKALKMDIYQPDQSIDSETNRPLIIVLHTGNFLPAIINGSPTGTRKDSAIVEACMQFAKRGYVVASTTYRLGWNPTSTDEEVRRGTLLQAVYRAILDVRTAVRYMRKEKATNNNPYHIDDSKIALYGHGSGGYVALATGYLDKQAEMELPKFVSQIDAPPLFVQGQSYILPSLLGNIDGSGGNAAFNNYEYSGYSNAVSMVMNVGGALADTAWMNSGEPSVASVHCIRDPFAPFHSGIVVVPTTQGDVVDVQGANVFIENANAKGLNNAYNNVLFSGDPYTARARSLYNKTYSYDLINSGGTVTINNPDGLFPIDLPSRTSINRFANQGSPWDWWDINVLTATVAAVNAATGQNYDANVIDASNTLSNPGMSAVKGKAYMDTVINYFCPRIMRQLQVGNWEFLGTPESLSASQLSLYPNPANGLFNLNANEQINNVEIMDITGKLVFSNNYNSKTVAINTTDFSKGVYIVRVRTNTYVKSVKLMID
ncbi:MAG: T9SS type A sorting domain-containing protein [Bacteroidia bacterium]|nr:T9SS type A sorting domain-containing protein [Bacteroidia bacterium]MCZ2247361.1 T9SS type A sorting domain-containing protein [Bacteroidia bacterium]